MFGIKSCKYLILFGLPVSLCLSYQQASAQYQFGVGRNVGINGPREVGRLRTIGGFQRVSSNAVLNGSQANLAPMQPLGNKNFMARSRRGGATELSRYSIISGNAFNQSRIQSALNSSGDLFRQNASLRSAQRGGEQLMSFRNQDFRQSGVQRSMSGGGGLAGSSAYARNYGSSRSQSILGNIATGAGSINTMMRTDSLSKNIAIGSTQTDRNANITTRPAVSLDEVIKERLDGQIKSYLSRGEAELRSGKYHEAYNTYKLADIIESGNRPAKQGIIYASIATERYTVARNTLFWLLEHDPDVMTKTIDVDTVFGNRTTSQRHLGALNSFVTVNSAPDYICLQAFILWNAGDKTRALSLARGAAAETEPNSVHHILLSRMEAGMQTNTPSNPPSLPPQVKATSSIQ